MLLCGTALFAQSTFINGELPTGTATTFSDTVNGLTATFSSPSDPGSFATTTNFFSFAGWQLLSDPGPAAASNIPLDIAFSAPVTSISMDFGLSDTSGPFELQAYAGSNLVGTAIVDGTVPGGFYFAEGAINYTGVFDSVVLTSSTTQYFGVANITATPAPEPSSLMLLGTALAGVGGFLRRKLAK